MTLYRTIKAMVRRGLRVDGLEYSCTGCKTAYRFTTPRGRACPSCGRTLTRSRFMKDLRVGQ